MRVLVTGANGFLGRHVARVLGEGGLEVTGFDLHADATTGVRSVVGDICDFTQIRQASVGKDVICHVAAIGDVYLAAKDPPLASRVNVTGSANVAEAAVANGCKVVYASTWEVYGQPQYEPIDEKHPTAPDHPYNITKLAGERLLLAADHLRGVPVVALRLGTAYGTGLRPNSVFSLFIDQARRGEPITIQGDGSQRRQFTHASDLAKAFLLACQSDVHGQPFNTIAPEQISIKDLAELVIRRLPTELVYAEARFGDIPSGQLSADAIKRVLGWEPETSFESGLNALIDTTLRV
ncbi:MAG TPA: NAD-dependent epimerase/dehydratase family protein [Acidimicrobiia bacterium]|nr:NAD-dependent epimerase/dehydratase family protein [Acidimicrobiia bacterium]